MTEGDAGKKAEKPKQTRKVGGGTAEDMGRVRQAVTAWEGNAGDKTLMLMEEVCAKKNLRAAYKRVVQNKGAPGVDGMTVDELGSYWKEHGVSLQEVLLGDVYEPQAVRVVEMPKPGGGVRKLGIPTVVDRMIQQAILQVLTPIFDPTFSEASFGFRPGRGAHDAVKVAKRHIAEGFRWVVDLDLEKFFDRVNHDILMSRVARRVKDKRVLRLIRRYLQAGAMEGGLVSQRAEGTPQGGPLSPLLSNILLDELDKELEGRGHRFVRYADDSNVYVKSERAGKRVLASLEQFLWNRLKLKINRDKSAIDRPWNRKFLGYSVTANREPKLRVAPQSVKRLKDKLRDLFCQARGWNVSRLCEQLTVKLRGWMAYFKLVQVEASFEVLDKWIRRKVRAIYWRHWKRPKTRQKELTKRGIDPQRAWKSANNGHGPWWNAGASHMNQAIPKRTLTARGLMSLVQEHRRIVSTL
jgi:RNA-directed DNA polymerase